MTRTTITRRPMTPAMKRQVEKLKGALEASPNPERVAAIANDIAGTAMKLDGVLKRNGALSDADTGPVQLHCLDEGMTLCGKVPREFSAIERWVGVRDWRAAQHHPGAQPCLECLKWLMKLRPDGIDEPCPVCGRGGSAD